MKVGSTYTVIFTAVLKIEAVCSPKRWYIPTSPDDVATQKTNIDIFAAVRTSNLIRGFVSDFNFKFHKTGIQMQNQENWET
jgi:hypothetical protein